MSQPAVKIIMMDVPAEIEADYNDWHDSSYVSSMLRLPGFLSARRFDVFDGCPPRSLTVFDLSGVEAVASDEHLELHDTQTRAQAGSFGAALASLPSFSIGVYRQIYPDTEYRVPDTPVLFAAGIDVPPEKEPEFNAWYNTDHIAALEKVPGFVTARRFRAASIPVLDRQGISLSGPKYLALYDIASEEVLKSPAFYQAARSPWTSWVHSWYTRRFRLVGRRAYPNIATTT